MPEIDWLSEQQNLIPISSVKDLTKEDLETRLDPKTKATQPHLAVGIMNAITTKEQKIGRSVMGTKTRPTCRDLFFKT